MKRKLRRPASAKKYGRQVVVPTPITRISSRSSTPSSRRTDFGHYNDSSIFGEDEKCGIPSFVHASIVTPSESSSVTTRSASNSITSNSSFRTDSALSSTPASSQLLSASTSSSRKRRSKWKRCFLCNCLDGTLETWLRKTSTDEIIDELLPRLFLIVAVLVQYPRCCRESMLKMWQCVAKAMELSPALKCSLTYFVSSHSTDSEHIKKAIPQLKKYAHFATESRPRGILKTGTNMTLLKKERTQRRVRFASPSGWLSRGSGSIRIPTNPLSVTKLLGFSKGSLLRPPEMAYETPQTTRKRSDECFCKVPQIDPLLFSSHKMVGGYIAHHSASAKHSAIRKARLRSLMVDNTTARMRGRKRTKPQIRHYRKRSRSLESFHCLRRMQLERSRLRLLSTTALNADSCDGISLTSPSPSSSQTTLEGFELQLPPLPMSKRRGRVPPPPPPRKRKTTTTQPIGRHSVGIKQKTRKSTSKRRRSTIIRRGSVQSSRAAVTPVSHRQPSKPVATSTRTSARVHHTYNDSGVALPFEDPMLGATASTIDSLLPALSVEYLKKSVEWSGNGALDYFTTVARARVGQSVFAKSQTTQIWEPLFGKEPIKFAEITSEMRSKLRPKVVKCYGEPVPGGLEDRCGGHGSDIRDIAECAPMGDATLSGGVLVESMEVRRAVTRTTTHPLLSAFLLKHGDDLRIDAAVMQVFAAMNMIWRLTATDSCDEMAAVVTYRVLPLTPSLGCIELVPNCHPVSELRNPVLNRTQMNRLVLSTAGAVLGAIALGVRDRHRNNVLIRSDNCSVFNIDFEFILGKKVAGIDAFQVPISEELWKLFGERQWKRMLEVVRRSYFALRTHFEQLAFFAETAFYFVSRAHPEFETVVSFMRKSLRMQETKEKAWDYLVHIIQMAPRKTSTKVKNYIQQLKG